MTTKHRNTVMHNKALRSSEFNCKENKKKNLAQNKLKNNKGFLSMLSAWYFAPKAKTLLKTTEGFCLGTSKKLKGHAQHLASTVPCEHLRIKILFTQNYEKTPFQQGKKKTGGGGDRESGQYSQDTLL